MKAAFSSFARQLGNNIMSITWIIILIAVSIAAILLVSAAFMRKEHYVRREITIHAPHQEIFDYVKLIGNQEKFSKWAAADTGRKKEFRGTDGTVGFVLAWSGDKSAGEGEKEIVYIEEGRRIEMVYRFTKPMSAVARTVMELESVSENETRVSWSNRSDLKYPLNIMVPMVEKMISRDMDESLGKLKNIFEPKNA